MKFRAQSFLHTGLEMILLPRINVRCVNNLIKYEVFQKQSSGVLKDAVLKIFAKSTGKPLCWSFFFNKVAGLRPEACFLVNFAKVLRKTFL